MDPVARQFAALAEQDGKLWVRYRTAEGPREEEMSYRRYRIWLDQAHRNGFTLEKVETVRAPT